MAYYASVVVYKLFRTVLMFCATPVKVILGFKYATATPILKATPLQFSSEPRNGYYLRRKKLSFHRERIKSPSRNIEGKFFLFIEGRDEEEHFQLNL